MTISRNLLAFAVVASAGATASAGIIFDRATWVSSVGGPVTTPDYSGFAPVDFPPDTPVDLGGNFTVTSTGGSTGDADLNTVPNFVFDFAPGGLSSVTFEFPTPILGFAALWSNTFVQDGFTVSSPFNDYDLNVISSDLNAQFIGFTEASPFTTVTFTATNDPGDDFVFFREFEFAVPSPGAASALMAAGVLGLRRRR
jgi:hypothetical protein